MTIFAERNHISFDSQPFSTGLKGFLPLRASLDIDKQ
jgi:hypothetical protein